MFLLESVAGILSYSTALLADSVDMFIGNVGVLVAAAGVSLSGSAWPDMVVGLLVAAVFCRSAIQVLRDASREFQFSN
jgi:Co/Zn/Cd efflux system component